MTWFKVDDGFHDHPKVLALLEEKGGDAAIGLWTVCGSWCSKHETDGVVPSVVVRAKRGTAQKVALLVKHGLWEPYGDGYRFHDWASINPLKSELETKREQTKQRVAKFRESQAGNKPSDPGARRVGNALPGSKPDPTRPDPTRPDPLLPSPSGGPSGGECFEFDPVALDGGGQSLATAPSRLPGAQAAAPVATPPVPGLQRARGGSPSPLGSVLGSVVGSLAEAAPAAVYTPPPEPTLPAPVALPLPVRRTSWHAERAALLFRREWAQRYAGSEPTMGGRSVAGLHERVASTAEARGEDPEVLFLAVLGRWLMRERTEVEARAPFACFASRWGELTMPEGSIVAQGQGESIEAQIKRAESELDALAKRGAPTAELKQIGDRIRALYRERDQRDEKWGPRAKR